MVIAMPYRDDLPNGTMQHPGEAHPVTTRSISDTQGE